MTSICCLSHDQNSFFQFTHEAPHRATSPTAAIFYRALFHWDPHRPIRFGQILSSHPLHIRGRHGGNPGRAFNTHSASWRPSDKTPTARPAAIGRNDRTRSASSPFRTRSELFGRDRFVFIVRVLHNRRFHFRRRMGRQRGCRNHEQIRCTNARVVRIRQYRRRKPLIPHQRAVQTRGSLLRSALHRSSNTNRPGGRWWVCGIRSPVPVPRRIRFRPGARRAAAALRSPRPEWEARPGSCRRSARSTNDLFRLDIADNGNRRIVRAVMGFEEGFRRGGVRAMISEPQPIVGTPY